MTLIGADGSTCRPRGRSRHSTAALPGGDDHQCQRAPARRTEACRVARGPPVAAQGLSPSLASAERPTDAFTGAALAGLARRHPWCWALPYCLPAASRGCRPRTHGCRGSSIIGGERSGPQHASTGYEACRSITDPASTWVLVNKQQRPVPQAFRPARPDRARHASTPAVIGCGQRRPRPSPRWRAASVEAGAGRIGIDTAYRSLATQDALYDEVARPSRPGLDRHLVPAARVQRAPDRA